MIVEESYDLILTALVYTFASLAFLVLRRQGRPRSVSVIYGYLNSSGQMADVASPSNIGCGAHSRRFALSC